MSILPNEIINYILLFIKNKNKLERCQVCLFWCKNTEIYKFSNLDDGYTVCKRCWIGY